MSQVWIGVKAERTFVFMRLRSFLVATFSLLAACEHGVDVVGTVTVPPDVQAFFSDALPGRVIVQAEVPNVTFMRTPLGILCSPSTQPRQLPVKLFTFGCGVEGDATITAWAASVPSTERVACDDTGPYAGFASDPLPEGIHASAEKQVSVDVSGWMGCKDGYVDFGNLVLVRSP